MHDDLDRQVFGRITIKEIIGASPPAAPDMQDALAAELDLLSAIVRDADAEAASKLLAGQRASADAVNSRPGAMALAQDKIRLYNKYHNAYVRMLEDACRQQPS